MLTQEKLVSPYVSTTAERRLVELDPGLSIALLATVNHGRVVFTRGAKPAIRPGNHLVNDGEIIVRTRQPAKAIGAVNDGAHGTVIAYQADQLDPDRPLAWSVVVIGYARQVLTPGEIARLERGLTPWIDPTQDTIIRIHPEIITGFQLIDGI